MALAEGEEGTGTGSIDYAEVTSCMTVTCLLEDGSAVGGHLSLQRKAGKHDSTEVLPAMQTLIGGKKVTSVVLAGQMDLWNPAYLQKPAISDAGENNHDPALSGDSMWSAIFDAFSLDLDEVKTEQKTLNGSFTITPTPPV